MSKTSASNITINSNKDFSEDFNISTKFDPVACGLDSTFRLTNLSDFTIRGLKLREDRYGKLILSPHSQEQHSQDGAIASFDSIKRIDTDLDCTVKSLRYGSLCLVQTSNIINCIVDDPYMFGKIACSSVLSGLYATGIINCDGIQMQVYESIKMTGKEHEVIMPLIYKGFKDCATECEITVFGGTVIANPWLAIGGVATKICERHEYIISDSAVPGDVIVLTKPLGAFVAVNAYQWISIPERWNRLKAVVAEEDIQRSYWIAIDSMARPNKSGSRLMHYYNAHCSTDIGNLGILGHAQTLASRQKQDVSFVIHNLPIISKMAAISKVCGNMFQLAQGNCPEVSGGLLICLPREQAAAFCRDIERQEKYHAWIIGIVEKGNRTARIIDKPRVIDYPSKD